eukprot:365873-Chlamydomonas_euryale.AAC.1
MSFSGGGSSNGGVSPHLRSGGSAGGGSGGAWPRISRVRIRVVGALVAVAAVWLLVRLVWPTAKLQLLAGILWYVRTWGPPPTPHLVGGTMSRLSVLVQSYDARDITLAAFVKHYRCGREGCCREGGGSGEGAHASGGGARFRLSGRAATAAHGKYKWRVLLLRCALLLPLPAARPLTSAPLPFALCPLAPCPLPPCPFPFAPSPMSSPRALPPRLRAAPLSVARPPRPAPSLARCPFVQRLPTPKP